MSFRVNCILGILSAALWSVECHAADLPSRSETPRLVDTVVRAPVPQSIMVFGGPLSTGSLGDTIALNLSGNDNPHHWDNYIVGGAYRREIMPLWYGFSLGFEAGAAYRFGHYRRCCNPAVKSTSLVHSVETWGGLYIRYQRLTLGDALLVSAGLTVGLSYAPKSIGVELERESRYGGRADLLFYLSPEIAFSLSHWPAVELVGRVHHRSGAGGNLGKMHEGYNAFVIGARYRL